MKQIHATVRLMHGKTRRNEMRSRSRKEFVIQERRRKTFGQHFLADRRVIDQIVEFVAPSPEQCFFEIGPGRGALTLQMAPRVKALRCLETDWRLAEELSMTLKLSGIETVTISKGDALEFDYGELGTSFGGAYRVIANLPYHVATPIYLKLLQHHARQPGDMIDMTLMFQKEVGERICADIGKRAHGFLSVVTKIYYDARKVMIVSPRAFRPWPKVYSMVVHFTPLKKPRIHVEDLEKFFLFLRAVFGYKRKTLTNSLLAGLGGMIDKAGVAGMLKELKLNAQGRPETLDLDSIHILYNGLRERALV